MKKFITWAKKGEKRVKVWWIFPEFLTLKSTTIDQHCYFIMLNINTFMMIMIIVVQMKHNYFETFKLDISKDCLIISPIIHILAILFP